MMVRARGYALTLEVGLVMLVAALAALGVSIGSWAVLDELPADTTPPAPHARATGPVPLERYEPILARDLFDPDAGHGATTGGALRLWGVGLYGGEARAVVEDTTTHRQALYRIGDEVLGARIASIEWNRITLTRSGREETLELSAPAAEPSAPASAPALAEAAPGPAPIASGGIRRTGANGFVV